MDAVIAFFEESGWLANAIQFFLYVVAGIGVLWASLKRFPWGRSMVRVVRRVVGFGEPNYSNFSEFVKHRLGSYEQVMGKVKRGTKIAIVDDCPDDFPIAHLQDIGFQVTVYTSITLAQVDSELRRFHVVFLDIADVLLEDPINGGVQVLERLTNSDHKACPVVIAVSGQQFDIERGQFYKKAHDVVKKPIDVVRCETVLLDVIHPVRAARQLDESLNKSSVLPNDCNAIVWSVIEYIRGERSWEKTEHELQKHQWPDLHKSKAYADSLKRWVK